MRRLLPTSLFLLVLALFVPSARAQQADYEDAMVAMRALLETQQRRFDATTRGDLSALDSLLAPNLVYTHSNGRTETKEEFLESLHTGRLRYVAIEPSDVNVQLYTDTGVITGEAEVRVVAGGEELALALRFTEVYVRWEAGEPWQLVVWQSTRLP